MEKQKLSKPVWSVIAIFISLVSLSYTAYNDYKIKNISFDSEGLQNRPLIEFENKIDIIHYKYETKEPVSAKDLYQKKLTNLNVVLTIDPELTVINKGVTVAKILCEVVTDQYSGLPEIRKKILSDKIWKSFREVKRTDEFYKTKDILPGKSLPIRLPCTLKHINFDLNECTIHYLIIYSNEIGNIYDSYFWVRFKMEPFEMHYSTNGNLLRLQFEKEKVAGSVKVVDTHFSTFMYSRQESKRITEIVKQHSNAAFKKNYPKVDNTEHAS